MITKGWGWLLVEDELDDGKSNRVGPVIDKAVVMNDGAQVSKDLLVNALNTVGFVTID